MILSFIYIYRSFTFDSKNNIIIQLNIILINETSVLESFFQIFGTTSIFFQNFQIFLKNLICAYPEMHVCVFFWQFFGTWQGF
jgi:hypothetical protein